MRNLAEYVVSIAAAALVCGIVGNLMPKGTAKEILKLVGGLFLMFTVIRPIANIQIPDLAMGEESYREEAALAVSEGESMIYASIAGSIKQELEAYILDKARSLGTELEVQVLLEDRGYIPISLYLEGNASPHARNALIQFLTEELGIQEEKIQWNERRSGSE
ncbi:MAG: stage III sporulation protein AF [Oscillospiraceae bacterium]|nr:stage III sporulation protein AF [Oscillospiraceae bacterium]